MKRDIVCHCGNTMHQDFPEYIDLSKEPQIGPQILEGTFMQVTCDSCGETIKPDLPVHFSNLKLAGGLLDIDYIPELDRTQFFRNKITSSAGRVAIGYPELREKILASENDLDNRALEVLKVLLLEKALEKDLSTHTFSELSIVLHSVQDNQLLFYLYGLKDNEIAVPHISMDIYNKVRANLAERLKNEPYAEIVTPPYVSINKISIEAEDDS